MAYNKLRCRDVSVQYVYDNGELYVDTEVCPFQYFCNCLCAEFNNQTCFEQCGAEGRIPIPGITSVLYRFLYAHFSPKILIQNVSCIRTAWLVSPILCLLKDKQRMVLF